MVLAICREGKKERGRGRRGEERSGSPPPLLGLGPWAVSAAFALRFLLFAVGGSGLGTLVFVRPRPVWQLWGEEKRGGYGGRGSKGRGLGVEECLGGVIVGDASDPPLGSCRKLGNPFHTASCGLFGGLHPGAGLPVPQWTLATRGVRCWPSEPDADMDGDKRGKGLNVGRVGDSAGCA